MVANAIVPINEDQAIVSVQILARIVRRLRESVFVEGQDFGVIPGTGTKPVLLLPGMEKLMRGLRLRPEYELLSEIQDFDKPLFYFRYECRLYEVETGFQVSAAVGSANSMESKWRWREAKRTCPRCGQATINRSKYPPRNQPNAEPGWYCFTKAGGCGAEFAAQDEAITGQATGRIENPDIFDQINTIDKIAQKRALASAIKGAANVSEFFTVDLEDLPAISVSKPAVDDNTVEGTFEEVAEQLQPKNGSGGRRAPQPPQPPADEPEAPQAPEHLQDWGEYWPHSMTLQRRSDGNFMYVMHTTSVNITSFTADPFRQGGFSEEEILDWKDAGKVKFKEPVIVEARMKGNAWEIRKVTR